MIEYLVNKKEIVEEATTIVNTHFQLQTILSLDKKMMRDEDQQSKLFYELCALALSIIQPPSIPATTTVPPSSSSSRRRTGTQVSPAAFASLLLGVSLALMFCGSVTFVLGFILMPWVLGLLMVLYFVGIVSNLSLLGRALLSAFSPAITSPPPPPPTMARSPKQLSELKYYEVACC